MSTAGVSQGDQTIDAAWLHARGDLHDSIVKEIRIGRGTLEVDIVDEWVNERGLSLPEDDDAPATLMFANVRLLEARLSDWFHELISEITVSSSLETGVRYDLILAIATLSSSGRPASAGACLDKMESAKRGR